MFSLILGVLKFLGELFGFVKEEYEAKVAADEQKEAQVERDNIEDNPVDWANQHFDGDRKLRRGEKTNKARSDETNN